MMQNLNKESQTSMSTQIQSSPLKENQGNTGGQPVKNVEGKHYFFETQTKRLKAYYLNNKQKLIGRTILFNNDSGKVRYFGTLKHQGIAINAKEQLWIGMEWDLINRGKHNGTVNGYKYFQCPPNQGSLIKFEKIQFGYKLQTALFKRYFKASQLHHAKDIYDNLKQIKEQIKKEPQQSKATKTQELMIKKIHKIEYDSQAYFDTIKKTKKIMIQFVGFDEIWTKLNNLDKIQSISLADCRISDLGSLGNLHSLLRSLKILSLQNNYLSDWRQIYQLGYQLPQLTQLSVSHNLLNPPEDNFQDLKEFNIVGREQNFDLTKCKELFPKLKCLIVINTGLTWKSFFKVLPVFANVEEFILCKNSLSDIENISQKRLLYLQAAKFINLEETQLKSFQDIMIFNTLPNLEKLTLNKNKLNELTRKITGFENLKQLSIQNCNFTKPVVLYQASLLPNLQSINIKHNPIGDKLGNIYVRMRAVAQMQKLNQINGAQLKKYQRKDCQIFYLRQAFRQYFAFKKVPDYDYDFEDFMKYCEEHHPNIGRLIKKYGNPYEVQKKQIKEIIKQEVKDTQTKKGTGMVDIFLEYKQTGFIDKKKLPLSWTLSNLKNFFTKTIKIPIGMLKLTLFNSKQAPSGEQMLQDHKTLSYYILKAGMKIVVQRKS